MAKVSKAEQAYQEWKQRNQVISQLNQLKQQGYTTEQVRAAGSGAYNKLAGPQQVTVKDGQTLDQIAKQNGTSVPDILNANPDMTSPKTGMVLSVPPAPGSEGWRVQNAYKPVGGLPSNAAMGMVNNTNPQGVNMWQGTTPGYNTLQRPGTLNTPAPQTGTPFGPRQQPTISAGNANPFAQYEYKPPAQKTPYPLYAPQTQTQSTPAPLNTTTFQEQRPVQQPRNYNQQNLAGLQAMRVTELYDNVNAGTTPTDSQLQYLIERGLITPTDSGSAPSIPSYSGGGFYRRGGYGGGGGGYRPGRGGVKRAKPAFSSGTGFGGLVNWRL